MATKWLPRVGGLISWKLTPSDDQDIIPWLASKGLSRGEVSDFLRALVRREMQREAAGVPVDVNELASRLTDQLLTRLRPVLMDAATRPLDEVEQDATRELNDGVADLFADLGVDLAGGDPK